MRKTTERNFNQRSTQSKLENETNYFDKTEDEYDENDSCFIDTEDDSEFTENEFEYDSECTHTEDEQCSECTHTEDDEQGSESEYTEENSECTHTEDDSENEYTENESDEGSKCTHSENEYTEYESDECTHSENYSEYNDSEYSENDECNYGKNRHKYSTSRLFSSKQNTSLQKSSSRQSVMVGCVIELMALIKNLTIRHKLKKSEFEDLKHMISNIHMHNNIPSYTLYADL